MCVSEPEFSGIGIMDKIKENEAWVLWINL